MKQLAYFIIAIFAISCKGEAKNEIQLPEKISAEMIKATKWEIKHQEGFVNYISFETDTYEEYNGELNETYSGKYFVKQDTIYLTEIGPASGLPGAKKEITGRSKCVVINNQLKFKGAAQLLDGKWQHFGANDTAKYFFTKVAR